MNGRYAGRALIFLLALVLAGCSSMQTHRQGYVKDRVTGIQYGSSLTKVFMLDPAELKSRAIKLVFRNVSGDTAYDLGSFRAQVEDRLRAKGYRMTTGDDFGLRIDIIVRYSGHYQSDYFQDAPGMGALAGYGIGSEIAMSKGNSYRQDQAIALSVVGGVALGWLVDHFVKEDTFMVVTNVMIGRNDRKKRASRSIDFSKSARYEDPDEEEERLEREKLVKMRKIDQTLVTSYAGALNIDRDKAELGVKERLIRIISDVL